MSTNHEIQAIEERLERRRELMARHLDDVKVELSTAASKATRSWPVLAVAGGLAAGYAISRTGRHRAPAPIQYVPVKSANGQSHVRATSVIAALLGIAATALRIGTSSEARVFFNAVKRFRDRRRQ